MLQYRLYNGEPLPANLEGFVKAGANIGSVIGQFAFGKHCRSLLPDPHSPIFLIFSLSQSTGYAADALGRKKVCKSTSFLLRL